MPLDLVGSEHLLRSRLDIAIADLGITPVSNDVLQSHKISEAAKHPGSWLGRIDPTTFRDTMNRIVSISRFIALGGVIVMMGTVIAYFLGAENWPMFVCSFGCITMLIAGLVSFGAHHVMFGGYKVAGPARWAEATQMHYEYDSALAGVPAPIAELVGLIRDKYPTARVIIGTLYQDDVVLDPYLIVRDVESFEIFDAVIGIWDGETIIQIAKKD